MTVKALRKSVLKKYCKNTVQELGAKSCRAPSSLRVHGWKPHENRMFCFVVASREDFSELCSDGL